MEALAAAINGFFLGGGLIVAIGAQNAFILRQGLLRRHVTLLVALSACSDSLLIALGVAGLGALVTAWPPGMMIASLGGAAFLTAYGVMAFRRALHPGAMEAAAEAAPDLRAVLLTWAAFTFLNPHVYLDTVVLVGSVSARHEPALRPWFAGGAMVASAVWFASLGYGARLLAPVFARPMAWRVLDGLIALVMFVLAGTLLLEVAGG